jgi:hypothetical protein
MDSEGSGSDSDDSNDNSSDEDEYEDPFEHPFFAEDTRYIDGARLLILTLDQLDQPTNATEYCPGGYLAFKLQSGYEPISEAFITVCVKDNKFDSFSKLSGARVGKFHIDAVMPWMGVPTEGLVFDPALNMYKRGSQPGVKLDPTQQALSYRNPELLAQDGSLKVDFASNYLDVVWECPHAFELGAVVVNVNLKLRGSNRWQALKYSLRESPIRLVNQNDDGSVDSTAVQQVVVNAEGERFLFDQVAQHAQLWDAIRSKNWDILDSMLDEKVVANDMTWLITLSTMTECTYLFRGL